MIDSYEINYDTLAIIPINSKISKVIENNSHYIVNKSSIEIIDDSCRYFGSTFKGRHEATKNILGITYKSPIIIEETRNIIFFPTSSPRYNNCYWISLNNIKSSSRLDNFCQIIFNNDLKLELNISYSSLQNQILRASMLDSIINKRKNYKNV